MKRLMLALAIVLGVALAAGPAMAVPFTFGDGGAGLQKVLDDITVGPVAGDSSVDVVTDAIGDLSDSYWELTASGGSVATMIIELAGYASSNTFGVYNNNVYVELFDGSSDAGDQVTLSIMLDGTVKVSGQDSGKKFSGPTFGYYLGSPDGLFHSDTALNTDGVDHMAAYQGTGDTVQLPGYYPGTWTVNEYILAFEDLSGGGDKDYRDMVLMVESVQPVPEPGTLLLLGGGLVGLAYLRKRKKA